jgi:peptide-methionine (R)-S-oxide reductase
MSNKSAGDVYDGKVPAVLHRRRFVKILLAGAGVLSFLPFFTMAESAIEPLSLSDEEWKKRLTVQQYRVLRHKGTELAFSSPLNNEKHDGMFVCAGCGLPLFPSRFKFDSGTGWPSFFDALSGHVKITIDDSRLVTLTEYHCARCGGHQGHVFKDGPAPTGLRYCNNGVALKFVPQEG